MGYGLFEFHWRSSMAPKYRNSIAKVNELRSFGTTSMISNIWYEDKDKTVCTLCCTIICESAIYLWQSENTTWSFVWENPAECRLFRWVFHCFLSEFSTDHGKMLTRAVSYQIRRLTTTSYRHNMPKSLQKWKRKTANKRNSWPPY